MRTETGASCSQKSDKVGFNYISNYFMFDLVLFVRYVLRI